jgi:malto-oligosyltrehalose synthase
VRPTATYRLQLQPGFGFRDAAAITPYLARLGVSHVYLSPVLQAVPVSMHGYDVVDHSRLSADLGGDDGWAVLVAACRAHGLGIVLDVVPNHMAVPNPQYDDVIAHGQASPFAHWFDIDWSASDRAAGELVYRRFFDVSSLIGVRVEEPDVYAATHTRLLELVRSSEVDGLRVDHPDGLADPRAYLDRLADDTGGIWTVVEKILEPGEQLPAGWRCSGTTGYDAIAAITHVLLDPAGRGPLTDVYRELTGEPVDYEAVVEASKRHVVEQVLAPEVDWLVREFEQRAAGQWDDGELRTAVVELLIGFDVYRAYAGEAASAGRIDDAVEHALSRAPSAADTIRRLADNLGIRFEQTTGPVMAKGVEDTTFYRYLRLTALNEVGGNPGAFGLTVDGWHDHCRRIASDWPDTMTTLTTHDTKRSEDVRARLLVLAEIPGEWSAAVTRWCAAAASYPSIDANTQYLFWQTLVGGWPLTVGRMQAYLDKATHEAKQQTSWINRNDDYDEAVRLYAASVFANDALMSDVSQWFAAHIRRPGYSNALAQKLLALTMPGVPDIYQGQELTEPVLVDPDNRRPVDFGSRRTAISTFDAGGAVEDKLRVTAAALHLRRERATSFAAGYTPVLADGPAAEHAIAYQRGEDVIAVGTRLPVGLARRGGWGDTAVELPAGRWIDTFTGRDHAGTVPVGEIIATLPVALLARQGG